MPTDFTDSNIFAICKYQYSSCGEREMITQLE